MRRERPIALSVVVAALLASALIGRGLSARGPDAVDLPPPPATTILRAQALGDGQFAFRVHALRLQHLGNLGGRIVPYQDIDYARVAAWFKTLDRLDSRPDVVPATAALLYGGTQAPSQLRPVVSYLADHARRAPATKWRWMTHAIYLARYRLEDRELALSLARDLAAFDAPAVPGWAQRLELAMLADLGRTEAARALVERLLANDDELSHEDRRWLRRFLQRELN